MCWAGLDTVFSLSCNGDRVFRTAFSRCSSFLDPTAMMRVIEGRTDRLRAQNVRCFSSLPPSFHFARPSLGLVQGRLGGCKDLFSAVAGSEVKLTTTTTTASATSPSISSADSDPTPAEPVGVAADATATVATTFATTAAPIGASPRRIVSRVDPDSDSDGDGVCARMRRGRGPNRRRSTPCQP